MDSIWVFLNQIDSQEIQSKKVMQMLLLLAHIGDADERNRIAQICANCFDTTCNTKIAEKILLRLLGDADPIVRVNACDSLGSSAATYVMIRLLFLLKDKDPLMRGYAALSMADIGKKKAGCIKGLCRQILRRHSGREKEPWVQICYDGACYALGDTARKMSILEKLTSKDEHVRYLALQMIDQYVQWQDTETTQALLSAQKREEVEYIRQQFEKILCSMDGGQAN